MGDPEVSDAFVTAVSRSPTHSFSKTGQDSLRLMAGLGVEGDAHCGARVKHRSRAAKAPLLPNLRQVHLIQGELLKHLCAAGFRVAPGIMGENITTCGIDLLALPRGARLHLGSVAVVEVTGLRNPCRQLDDHQAGLMAMLLDRDPDGALVRKAGVMGIVIVGGEVRPSDRIAVQAPLEPHHRLEVV